MPETHLGGCMCGSVWYQVTGSPMVGTVCHCTFCQKRLASAFAVLASFKEEAVEFVQGEVREVEHRSDESGRWLRMSFCPECETTVAHTAELRPGMRTIAAGTFDDPSWFNIDRHIWVQSKLPWAGMPDDVVNQIAPDGHTAVIALSHDAKLDDLALLEALRSPAFYVGAIGSLANQRKRRARLKEHFGLDDAQLDRLHGPVGLKNGARTPPEIAVSILAELTAVRYRYRIAAPVPLDGDLPPPKTEARAPLLCATPADMTKLNNKHPFLQ